VRWSSTSPVQRALRRSWSSEGSFGGSKDSSTGGPSSPGSRAPPSAISSETTTEDANQARPPGGPRSDGLYSWPERCGAKRGFAAEVNSEDNATMTRTRIMAARRPNALTQKPGQGWPDEKGDRASGSHGGDRRRRIVAVASGGDGYRKAQGSSQAPEDDAAAGKNGVVDEDDCRDAGCRDQGADPKHRGIAEPRAGVHRRTVPRSSRRRTRQRPPFRLWPTCRGRRPSTTGANRWRNLRPGLGPTRSGRASAGAVVATPKAGHASKPSTVCWPCPRGPTSGHPPGAWHLPVRPLRGSGRNPLLMRHAAIKPPLFTVPYHPMMGLSSGRW
jgi:hypothetical protein